MATSAGAAEPLSWPPSGLSAQTSTTAPRLYVMSFVEADIAVVAEDVLGATLSVPYALDEGVAGRVTFKVEDRLTPEQLLAVFQASMAAQGFVVRPTASQFMISKAEAPATAMTPRPAAEKPKSSSAVGLLVILALVGAAAAVSGMLLARRRPRTVAEREAVLDYLVESGATTRRAVARARLVGRREGTPPDQALDRNGDLPDRALADAYAAAGGFEVWKPAEAAPLDPQPVLTRGGAAGEILALEDDGARLTVATTDPLDDKALAEVAISTGRRVRILVAARSDYLAATT